VSLNDSLNSYLSSVSENEEQKKTYRLGNRPLTAAEEKDAIKQSIMTMMQIQVRNMIIPSKRGRGENLI
jgi:hypothetical protein